MSIPIFDSLTHPSIDGNWILPKYPHAAKVDMFKEQMRQANVQWAFAVGMKGIGGYLEKEYLSFVQKEFENNVYPIAYYHPEKESAKEIATKLLAIKKMGYYGIKLHPRFSVFYPDNTIAKIIKMANDLQLVVMICTYNYGSNIANKITPETWMHILSKTENAKVVLMHAGAVRIMEYVEIARAFPNVLLDLSFTLCKYAGSSIDQDINFLFNNFDQRICIGSDFPEISLLSMRQRFDFFSKNIAFEKAENIAYKNIFNFIKK